MSDFYSQNDYRNYLSHHGIKNQKWGVRHGPPYPLSSSTHKNVIAGKINRQAIVEKRKENRRKKILHDPKKLYSHASEFSKEELDQALEKIKTMKEIEKQIPQKPKKKSPSEKREEAREEKRITKKINKYAKTTEDLEKNMHKLTKKEVDAALDRLKQREDLFDKKMNKIDKPRRVVDEIVSYLTSMKKLFTSVSTLFDPSPESTSKKEEHHLWLIDKAKKDDRYNQLIKQHERNIYGSPEWSLFQPIDIVTDEMLEKFKSAIYEMSHADEIDGYYPELNEFESYLAHHGIKGQHWGEKHGPPYPLGTEVHNRVVKRAEKSSANKQSSNADKSTKHKKLNNLMRLNQQVTQIYLQMQQQAHQQATQMHMHNTMMHQMMGKPSKKLTNRIEKLSKTAKGPELKGLTELLIFYGASIALAAASTAAKVIHDKNNKKRDEKREEKLNQMVEEKNANSKIDKKTGFRLKNEESTEKEDLKACNPFYGKNSSFSTTNNCAYCSFAYDLRRRGYDVMAKLSPTGVSNEDIFKVYKNAKPRIMDPFNAMVLDKDGKPTNLANTKNLSKARSSLLAPGKVNKVFKQLASEEGSRGLLTIYWQGGGGHATTYFVKNGKVKIADPQTGKILTFNSEYMNKVAYGYTVRLDNMPIEDIDLEEIKRYVT